jgi:hypothetical protein
MQRDDAFIVRLVDQPRQEITVADVILGSLGVAGAMTFAAVALGAVLGWLFIMRSRRHGIAREHPPSIHPFNPL